MAFRNDGAHNLGVTYLKLACAVAGMALLTSACAKKPIAVKQTPPAPVTQPAPAPTPQRAAATPARQPEPARAAAPSRYPDAATRARIDELLARIQDAYFDYDKHSLRADAVTALTGDAKELATIMNQYPDYKLTVEGYCDERGSSEYNLALGEARAKSAKDFLVSSGVSANQLATVSYGNERQSCNEHSETCWSKNRRVHIIAMK
jgi:peptidoglycan-associated lipoprotein